MELADNAPALNLASGVVRSTVTDQGFTVAQATSAANWVTRFVAAQDIDSVALDTGTAACASLTASVRSSSPETR